MAQTSINIRPVKGGSEQHNKREKELDYVSKDLSHLNEYWEGDTQTNRLAEIKERYKEKTGQKMQSKATPIREGVVVIGEETTLKDLQELGKRMQDKWGIECFQISIHKDEGHWEGDKWKPNLHAHLVFDWTNHASGKTIKLNRQDMVELQTMTADVLRMERGISSDKKHLEALQYKNYKEEQRLIAVREEKEQLNEFIELGTKGKELKELAVADAAKEIGAARKKAEKRIFGVKVGEDSGAIIKEISEIRASDRLLERAEKEALNNKIEALQSENKALKWEVAQERDILKRMINGMPEFRQFLLSAKEVGEVTMQQACTMWFDGREVLAELRQKVLDKWGQWRDEREKVKLTADKQKHIVLLSGHGVENCPLKKYRELRRGQEQAKKVILEEKQRQEKGKSRGLGL